jgi:hypothetical protein
VKSSPYMKPYYFRKHKHKTDRLTPYSHQTRTPPDLTIGATTAVCISYYTESPPSELNFSHRRTARSYSQAWQRWLVRQEYIIVTPCWGLAPSDSCSRGFHLLWPPGLYTPCIHHPGHSIRARMIRGHSWHIRNTGLWILEQQWRMWCGVNNTFWM